jgi:hypothetical protein|nr:MAG TPA: hypothetical protein [Caudoviricetes sp.]
MTIPTEDRTKIEVFLAGVGIVGVIWIIWMIPVAAQIIVTFSLVFILIVLIMDTMNYLEDGDD